MRSLKRDRWKAVVALAGLLFLSLLMVLIPLSASAHSGTPSVAMAGTVQTTPTVDLTVTALAKEQLALQVRQLQNQLQNQNSWIANNSTALIAAVASVIVALFGIYQWAVSRRDEHQKEKEAQDKELRDRAEERFKAAVTALGSANEATQVGGAILLRSFLNKDDKDLYGRYYTQIHDLAVAYLRLPHTSPPSEDPDGLPPPAEDPNAPLPLTPLRQALIVAFKEAFPLARDWIKEQNPDKPFIPQSLDASHINLDSANLMNADLKQAWMPWASLREVDLSGAILVEANLALADLSGAYLYEAKLSKANLNAATLIEVNSGDSQEGVDLSGAYLYKTNVSKAQLFRANLKGANLVGATLNKAKLIGSDFSNADLEGADLSDTQLFAAKFSEATLDFANLGRAHLDGVRIEEAGSVEGTDLRGVEGLNDEQKAACKVNGAIVDEGIRATPPRSNASQPAPIQSIVTPAQTTTPPASKDGNNGTAAQPTAEP